MAFRANVDSETPSRAANSTKSAFSSREGRAVIVGIGEVARSSVMRMSAACSETRTLRYPAIKSIPTPPTYFFSENDWPLIHEYEIRAARSFLMPYFGSSSLRRLFPVDGSGSGKSFWSGFLSRAESTEGLSLVVDF
jgi:hypothetical protein